MIRFFHTADIHFGMENYGHIDSTTGIHSRLLDFKRSLEFCVDKAIDANIDFFLFAGDAYKTANPTPTQQKLFLQQFLRLQQAGIPVVIIVGNHDHPMSFGKAHALDVFSDLPLKGFYTFSSPESIVLPTKSGPVQIVGIPWPTRHNFIARTEHRFKNAHEIITCLSERVSTLITNFAQKLDPHIPSVLTGHLTVSTGIFSGSEKTAILGADPILLPSQLTVPPFDYVGLGHLHRFQDLSTDTRCPLVYSGSIERIDFGERKDTKGFADVTITAGGRNKPKTTLYDFVKVPTRPMIQITVKLHDQKDQTEQILDEIKKQTLTGAILKIVYHVPPNGKDTVKLDVLQQACKPAWHIASIIPVHAPATRTPRIKLDESLTTPDLLKKYFEAKEVPTSKIKRLLVKAQHLIDDFAD